MKPIPVSEAKDLAKAYGYDQVIIMARKTGDDGGETVTTAGADQQHCDIAARIGDHLKFDLLKWARDDTTIHEDRTSAAEIERLRILVERQNALLRPFVAVANDYKDDAKDAWFVPCPLGACREARKAVSSVEKLSDC